MSAVVIRLRVFVAHDRFGGERFVAAFPRDRVRDLIARLLVEAGIEDDPLEWELADGAGAVHPGRTVSEVLQGEPPWDGWALRRSPPVSLPRATTPATPRAVPPPPATPPVPPPSPPGPVARFTDVLLAKKIISPEQLEEIGRVAAATGLKLPDALVKSGSATATEVARAVAEQHGMAFVDLSEITVPTSVVELVPESVARENIVLPLALDGNTLTVVVSDPTDFDTVQKLEFILNKIVLPVLATREQITAAINRHYGRTETESVDSMLTEFTDTAIEFTRTESPPAAAPPGGPPRPAPAPASDTFDTDFEIPSAEDSGSEVMRLDSDGDLEDEEEADFDDDDSEVVLTPPADAAKAEPATGAMAPAVPRPRTPAAAAGAAPETASRARFKGKSASRSASRRATVRYYSRMNPDRVFPLLVMLTREEVEKVVQKHVEQKATGPLKIAKDVPLEVEPVLPGCVCHPPRVTAKLAGGDQAFTFHVVPHVLGEVTGARVLIRQDHAVLAEVPLDMRVVQRTWVMVSGLSTFLLPASSAAMSHFGLDFRPKDGSSPYLAVLNFLFGQVSPVMLTAALAAVTGVAWWLTRPKGRDVFWDITTKPPNG